MKISKDKKYTISTTGSPAEILATNLDGDLAIAAKYRDSQGLMVVSLFREDGESYGRSFRLVEVKAKRKCWVAVAFNVEGSPSARASSTREGAIFNLTVDYKGAPPFACVEIEVEEDQGLS